MSQCGSTAMLKQTPSFSKTFCNFLSHYLVSTVANGEHVTGSDNIIEIRFFKLWMVSVALRLVLSCNSEKVLWGPVSLLALDWQPSQGVCQNSTHAPAPHDPEYE